MSIIRAKPPLGSQVDWGHPLAQGLGLCMIPRAGAGPAEDLVNRGAISVSGGATWATGEFGPTVYYNGSTCSTVANPHPRTLLQSGKCTVIARIWVATSGPRGIVSRFKTATNERAYWVIFGRTSQDFTVRTDGISGGGSTAAALTFGLYEWHVMAMVWDGAYVTWYLDDVPTTPAAFAPGIPYAGGAPLDVGAQYNSNFGLWYGYIDWVRLYDSPKTADEIAWLRAEPYADINDFTTPIFYSIPAGDPATIYSRRGLSNRVGTRTVLL